MVRNPLIVTPENFKHIEDFAAGTADPGMSLLVMHMTNNMLVEAFSKMSSYEFSEWKANLDD